MRVRRTAILVAALASSLFTLSTVSTRAGEAAPNCGLPGLQTRRLGPLPDGAGEVSGLATSHRHPGVGWMIRDSGHPPSLYSLRLTGGRPRVHEIRVLRADNRDWEDLSYGIGPDGRGRLWIVESTQSDRDPFICEVVEPDPDAPAVPLHARNRYAYPDRGPVNTEVSFMAAATWCW